MFDKVCGTDKIRKEFTKNYRVDSILDLWNGSVPAFRKKIQRLPVVLNTDQISFSYLTSPSILFSSSLACVRNSSSIISLWIYHSMGCTDLGALVFIEEVFAQNKLNTLKLFNPYLL